MITVGSLEVAWKLLVNGIYFRGYRFHTEHFQEVGVDAVCPRYSGIGYTSYRACRDRPPKYYIYTGDYKGTEHIYRVEKCLAKPRTAY